MIKFDSAASIEWVGLYIGTNSEGAFGVSEAHDGGYLLTGYSSSYGDSTKQSIMVMKISSTGQKLWSKLIGGLSATSVGEAIT